MPSSYRGIGCRKPDDVFHVDLYFLFDDVVPPDLFTPPEPSVRFPQDEIIKAFGIAISVKAEVVVLILKLHCLQYFEKLQSNEENAI